MPGDKSKTDKVKEYLTHLHIGIVARDKGLKTGDLYQIKSDMEKGGIHSETVAKSIAHLAENAEPKR